MREVKLVGGSLILTSKESQELFDRLAKEGLVWEYISGIFEANAKYESEVAEILELARSIDQRLRALESSGGVIPPAKPSILSPSPSNTSQRTSVDVQRVDPAMIKGNSKNILERMRGMGRKP